MPITLGELAKLSGAQLVGDPDCLITGVSTLKNARPGDIAFLSNRHYAQYLADTNASAVILSREDSEGCKTHSLLSDNPYVTYARITNYLYPPAPVKPGIHTTAVIGEGCKLADDVCVAAGAIIGDSVQIGAGSYIGPGCVIENDVQIGCRTRLLANNTVCHAVVLGDDVILHPGAIVGSDGFGMAQEKGEWLKIPQIGSVRIGNNVEIGANTTVDRGAIEDTVIENGVRIDNQVQIAHNVRIGENTAIAGCVAVAGSVTIGKRCLIGGLSAITGHIEICDDVMITGMSGVPNSIKKPGVYSSGLPVTENRIWRRNMARFRNLDDIIKKILKKLD